MSDDEAAAARHKFTHKEDIGALTTYFCTRCADWIGCYGGQCEIVSSGRDYGARIAMWRAQIERGGQYSSPKAPPKPVHDFSIVRGRGENVIRFCSVCGTTDFSAKDGAECDATPVTLEGLRLHIEATIGNLQAYNDWNRYIDRQIDRQADQFRARCRSYESNITAALGIVGGWDRRVPTRR